MPTLIYPFTQILTLDHLSLRGALQDAQLQILGNKNEPAGILVENDRIVAVELLKNILPKKQKNWEFQILDKEYVLTPALVDCHTHICSAGVRALDYSMRIAGDTYENIAQAGGGIISTVRHTRLATQAELAQTTKKRALQQIKNGVLTCEVKSGYGLDLESELKMLRAIKDTQISLKNQIELVPTCLSAHVKPPEFEQAKDYLDFILKEILPKVKEENLAQRVDIFVENNVKSAFKAEEAEIFLKKAQKMGFQITIHADQFSTGGSLLAIKIGAKSADHLENSTHEEIKAFANSNTVAVALPGASLGLGMKFTPARSLLDNNAILAIASDWNVGSAPMGDLLTQACILGVYEKLTNAETWAGMTFRSAYALDLEDRGTIAPSKKADMLAFAVSDFREILYYQGALKPEIIWKNGIASFF
jgi:imidazolonepropionase